MASNCPILFTHPFSPIYIFYSVTISPGYKKNSKNNRSLGRRESYGGGVGFSVTISPGYKKTVKTIVLLEGERVMEGEWGSPLQSPRVTKKQ